jgi:3-phenylpropionate/trans-cinnamate dioxygenase ferredoxin reductase subunit
MSKKTCIIVGAGHSAAQLSVSLRQEGWEGHIIVVGDEDALPYHRPPLSKAYLAGIKELNNILIRPAAFYEMQEIKFNLGVGLHAIDRIKKHITLNNGDVLHYDKLALTLGSRIRKLAIAGSELVGISYLKTAANVDYIKTLAKSNQKAVIIGGGYIGLETAAVLRKLGMDVTVLEMMPRVLERVTAPQLSEFYTRIHTEEGVKVVTNVVVSSIEAQKSRNSVVCSNGHTYPADLIIVGVGVLPNQEIAERAGLTVSNGIEVNEFACTSDPDIVASGDCAWHYNPIYKKYLRLESVQNATDQAKAAASYICDKPVAYHTLPWFWSDQYDMKLQIAGLSQGYDSLVVRGDIKHGRRFAVFYLIGQHVIAVDAVNSPAEFMIGKKLITENTVVDKRKLANLDISMKDMLTV